MGSYSIFIGKAKPSSPSLPPPLAGEETDTLPAGGEGWGGERFSNAGQSYLINPCPSLGVRPAMRSVRNFQMASAEGGQPGMK